LKHAVNAAKSSVKALRVGVDALHRDIERQPQSYATKFSDFVQASNAIEARHRLVVEVCRPSKARFRFIDRFDISAPGKHRDGRN